MWVQFSDGHDTACTSGPGYLIGTTGGLLVNLEPCCACGMAGWGWQDTAWCLGQSPMVTFDHDGMHTIRVQVRDDGVSSTRSC